MLDFLFMEALPIPKPIKKTDKGIAAQLRELRGSFSVYFEDVSRRTIYTTARRLGFLAVTRTEGDGLRVWRGRPIMGGTFIGNVPEDTPCGEDLEENEFVVEMDEGFGG